MWADSLQIKEHWWLNFAPGHQHVSSGLSYPGSEGWRTVGLVHLEVCTLPKRDVCLSHICSFIHSKEIFESLLHVNYSGQWDSQGLLTMELTGAKQNTPSYSGHHDGEEVFRNRCDSMGSSLGAPSFWWLILVDFLRNPKSSFFLCKRNTWGQLHWLQWQPKEREQEPPSYISVSWSLSEIAELSQSSWWFGEKNPESP